MQSKKKYIAAFLFVAVVGGLVVSSGSDGGDNLQGQFNFNVGKNVQKGTADVPMINPVERNEVVVPFEINSRKVPVGDDLFVPKKPDVPFLVCQTNVCSEFPVDISERCGMETGILAGLPDEIDVPNDIRSYVHDPSIALNQTQFVKELDVFLMENADDLTVEVDDRSVNVRYSAVGGENADDLRNVGDMRVRFSRLGAGSELLFERFVRLNFANGQTRSARLTYAFDDRGNTLVASERVQYVASNGVVTTLGAFDATYFDDDVVYEGGVNFPEDSISLKYSVDNGWMRSEFKECTVGSDQAKNPYREAFDGVEGLDDYLEEILARYL